MLSHCNCLENYDSDSNFQNLNTKEIYLKLLEKGKIMPLVVSKHPQVACLEVWPNIHSKFVEADYRDVTWRVNQGTLPVKFYL